jgi:hypothetical protein
MRIFLSELRPILENLTDWTTCLRAYGEYKPFNSFNKAALGGPRYSYI